MLLNLPAAHRAAADAGPLFMLLRAARSAEDAQLALGAVSCVRAARARLLRDTTPLGGQKFAAAFTRVGAQACLHVAACPA